MIGNIARQVLVALPLLACTGQANPGESSRDLGSGALAQPGAGATARTEVVGTGDPTIDVPGVQAAVDRGGEVMLRGHFSFDTAPTASMGPVLPALQSMILVSREVTISGARDNRDADGEMTTIEAGTFPFFVNAPGSRVGIQGLRFVRPKGDAIFVYSVAGLRIASCRIEGVDQLAAWGRSGIDVITVENGDVPSPTNPGSPESVSGPLLFVANDIDVGGASSESTLGITIFSVGVPGAEVDIYVAGNDIRNTTEPAINLRHVGGRAQVVWNALVTGSVAGTAPRPEVIRAANDGAYLIAHNAVDCGWANPDAQGIGVFSQFAEWPIEHATIAENNVTMSPPEGTVLDDASAAIRIFGFAKGNVSINNRIRGRATAGVSLAAFRGGIPADNALVLNRFDGFQPSLADLLVDDGVMNTLIVGEGSVVDRGTGTVVFPVAPHE
jgi:hypothetical protein